MGIERCGATRSPRLRILRTEFEIAIELPDDGEVSPFFREIVAVGDEIELRGPLGGHFIWTGSDGGPLLLMGGGSGVVPLMSMIRQREATAAHAPAILLLSARRLNEVLYGDELVGPERRENGFGLVLTLTREAPQREAYYGRRVDGPMVAEVLARCPRRRNTSSVERVRQRRSRRSRLRLSAGNHY